MLYAFINTKCFSGTSVNQIVIINIWMVNFLIFSVCYFRLGKRWCLQNLYSKKERSSTRILLKLWHCQIIWYLFANFKIIILCSVCSIRFVKYVLSTKIWFVKTSTRILKYESWVIKSNSDHVIHKWPLWLNGWVFIYELSGCEFQSCCSHLNFRFRTCLEQGVPWHSGNYRIWIHSGTCRRHDKNIKKNALH